MKNKETNINNPNNIFDEKFTLTIIELNINK